MNNLVKDQTKRKFNRLTPVKFVERKNCRTYWLCKCDCGNEKICPLDSLRKGHTKSCGCLKKEYYEKFGEEMVKYRPKKYPRGKNHPCFKGFEDLNSGYFNGLKYNADKRQITFKIDIKYLWDLFIKQNKRCALSGVKINLSSLNKNRKKTASLDRINSNKGYIKGNLQWVHVDIQFMKQDHKDIDFIQWCKLVAQNNPAY